MAAGARRQLIRSRTHTVDRVVGNSAVALVAQDVDIRHVQQPGVLRTVGSVATHASLGLDRGVLVHKGPACLRVALGADHVLIGGGLQVVVAEGAVGIVAVAAANRAFVHRMVEGHVECGFLVAMAGEAELGLFGLQQVLLRFRSVNAVTAETADVGLRMRGTIEVRVRSGVAAKAGRADVFSAELVEAADLGDIATAFNVGLARSVAAFAGHTFAGVLKSETTVGIRSEFRRDIRVTSGTGLLADEIRRVRCRLRLGSCRLLLATAGSERQPGSCEPGQ